MRMFFVAAVLAMGTGACSKKDSKPTAETQPASKVPVATVDDVAQALAQGACTPVDANGDKTREKMGVVPGAVLLSDSEVFALSELPADKSRALVFYCANTHCGASHEAAERALTAGYTNVKVMPAGIAGWVAAGKQVQSYKL